MKRDPKTSTPNFFSFARDYLHTDEFMMGFQRVVTEWFSFTPLSIAAQRGDPAGVGK
jgi:hypothetical protein